MTIPSAKGHWFFGNADDFARAPHLFPAELGWQHGGLAQFRVLNTPVLAVTHPDYTQHILVSSHGRYQRSFQYRASRVTLGKGLLSTDGEEWLRRRRQVSPAFRNESIKHLVQVVSDSALALLKHWDVVCDQGEAVPVVADTQRFALTVSGKALLSTDVSTETASLFGRATRESLSLARKRNTSWLRLPLWVPTQTHRRLHQTRAVLDQFILPFIQNRLTGKEPQSPDMLSALMQVRDPETNEPLSQQALLDETKTLFAAGFETTATALSWALYLLARHPEVAERWHEEVDRVLNGRSPTWDDLPKLRYTGQIVFETMRLYPPVYNIARECIQDDEIAGYPISKGMLILISVYGIHRSADWWTDPHTFRPERFAEDATWNKLAYLPFAIGKHTCIGNHLALLEITIALAMIGQRYRLQPLDERSIEPRPQITLVPAEEFFIRLIPRHE